MRRSRTTVVAVVAAGLALVSAMTAPANADSAHHRWMDTSESPQQRATQLVAQMTLDEKITELHGVRNSQHQRYVPGIPRLDIPPLRITNGPAGVGPSDDRQQKPATALPAPISLAATFDTGLARRYGDITGAETRDLAHSLLEGPDINIARVPVNGRTFEGYGEDPYLAGQLAAADIKGIQSHGVIAEVKHYDANNQESNRFGVDETIGDRTLHEIYLPAFETAVKDGHAGSVMCAYPKVNGTYNCQNTHLLTDVLRGQWGFDGFVQSDFGAAHSTVPSALAGMDLEMPTGKYYGDAMKQAVQDGQISEHAIDTLLIRRFTVMMRFGLFDRGLSSSPIPAKADGAVARDLAEQGSVLLRNRDRQLPLDAEALHSIAVVGPYAGAAKTGGGGSSHVDPLYTVSPVQGIQDRVGPGVTVNYAPGVDNGAPPPVPSSALNPPDQPSVHGLRGEYFTNQDLSGSPALTRVDDQIDANYGSNAPAPGIPADHFSIRWSGTLTAPSTGDYQLALTSDDGSRLFVDGKQVVDDWGDHSAKTETATVHLDAGAHSVRVEYYDNTGNASVSLGWVPPGDSGSALQQAVDAAKASDVAVVMVGDDETEGRDRPSLALSGDQDKLVEAVAAANPHTVVVVKSGGPVLMPWVDKVPAIVEAWYPGEEDGNAVAALLFGDVNPSGKLPITFPKADGDTPAHTPQQYPGVDGTAVYSEGLQVGYRWYDAQHIAPLYPFGYGLSYTSFGYSQLRVSPRPDRDGHVNVGVTVTNTGPRTGTDVAQVYVTFPARAGEPPRQLKGFQRVQLAPGQHKRLIFHLDRRAFSVWDSQAQGWTTVDGQYTVRVGDSSADLPLHAPVTVR